MSKMCGIYAIECTANGKVYIGSSVHITPRWNYHRDRLKHGVHPNPHLQRIYNKHGPENLEFVVVEICVARQLVHREQFWIDQIPLKKLINAKNATVNAARGIKRPPSFGLAQSNGRRVVGLNLENGDTCSWQYIACVEKYGFCQHNVAAVIRGVPAHSSHKGWLFWYEGEEPNFPGRWGKGSHKFRQVEATNIETGATKIYDAAKFAAEDGFSPSRVVSVALGKSKSHQGYTFRYLISG